MPDTPDTSTPTSLEALGETSLPCVMVFNANDPSGAGGLSDDITAMSSASAHVLPVVTGVYVRDTSEIHDHIALDEEAVTDQARCSLEDVPVQAFKVGFVGSPENLSAIAGITTDYAEVPVVAYMPTCRGGTNWPSKPTWTPALNCCCRRPPCWLATTAHCADGCCRSGKATARPMPARSPVRPPCTACPTRW